MNELFTSGSAGGAGWETAGPTRLPKWEVILGWALRPGCAGRTNGSERDNLVEFGTRYQNQLYLGRLLVESPQLA
jgi:hypothetical protein